MNAKNPLTLDAAENVFFGEQLTYVKARTYDVVNKDLKALTLLPVSTEGDPGAETISYKSYDAVGMAKIVADYATDFPRTDLIGEEVTLKVKSLGSSYGYSIQEIRRAQMAGIQLETRRATAARRAIDELQDKIAWFGDAKAKLNGFLTASGTNVYVAANNAAGTSKKWADKTADEIVADIAGIITAGPIATNGKEVPDTLLLPLSLYNLIMNTPYGSNRDKTILGFLRENYPQITRIDWVSELATAGASGASRVVAYSRDPNKVEVQIPLRMEQLPAQQKGMEFEVICHQRTAGVAIYYPMSVTYCDGL